MTAGRDGAKRRRRRHLTAQEKYQVWQEVVAGHGTQREIADKWGVDRSTVVHIVKLAKQGALERLAASNRNGGSRLSAKCTCHVSGADGCVDHLDRYA